MSVDFTKYAVMFNRARNNLLLVVVLTTLNLFLFITGANFNFLFTAVVPVTILEVADNLAWYFDNTTMWLGGIVLAFGVVFLYCLCWLMSKKRRAWILVALIIFSVDALFFSLGFITLLLGGYLEIFSMIVVAFYCWIMYYLITGTIAWAKLRKITPQQIDAELQTIADDSARAGAQKALEDLKQDEDEDSNDR